MIVKSTYKIPNVHIVKCENVDDFLKQIYPSSGMGNDAHKRWIFRGQPAKYDLVPSAFRGESLSVLTRCYYHKRSHANQISLELRALKIFLDAADRQGILVPGDTRAFRKKWINDQFIRQVNFVKANDLGFWPDDNGIQVLTFAQQSGLPTRLLDWTKRSYIAAYFAATGTANKAIYEQDVTNIHDDMAVWAFSDEFLHQYKDPEIEIIEVPTGSNRNLMLQQGCFTSVKTQLDNEDSRYYSFEEAASINDKKYGGIFPIRIFVLCSGQRRKLLKTLSEGEGIDGASMFSGVDGVMKYIKEKGYWSGV
jgi:hypothetical protein